VVNLYEDDKVIRLGLTRLSGNGSHLRQQIALLWKERDPRFADGEQNLENNQTVPSAARDVEIIGGRTRTRTLDPLIKSQIAMRRYKDLAVKYKISQIRGIQSQWLATRL
jgi:hypothetical protein